MTTKSHTDQETGAHFVRVAKPEPETLALKLTETEFQQMSKGIDGAQELIRDAGMIFDYLAYALSGGYLDGDEASLGALLRTAARAFKSSGSVEVRALELVDQKMMIARLCANGGVAKCN